MAMHTAGRTQRFLRVAGRVGVEVRVGQDTKGHCKVHGQLML